MLANYIINAIKYGGSPTKIEIGHNTIKAEKDSKEMVRFWVKDSGPGISSEDQKHVFKQFETLNSVSATGHGLGLSVVRRIIEKLGGQVGLESKPDEDCLFYFTLPIASKQETTGQKKINFKSCLEVKREV